ncbi:hypothetical protein LTR27_008988 [Elasticomyces elasticus]|nr:hypothetical protein LTR27_008988 [Elasticomyces elasticus]
MAQGKMASTLWPNSSQPANLNQVLSLSDSDLNSNDLRTSYNDPSTSKPRNPSNTLDSYDSDTDSEPEPETANILTFPLLDLPPELWLRIIQTAVQLPSPVTLTVDPWGAEHKPPLSKYPRTSKRYIHHLNSGHQPALSRVSRLLRKETLAQFYRLNDFEIVEETFNSGNLISEIGMRNLRNMREVNYRAVCGGSYGMRKVDFGALSGWRWRSRRRVRGGWGGGLRVFIGLLFGLR